MVWITGGERTSGSLDGSVLMVVYGDNGKTEELLLTQGQLCAEDQPPSRDHFEVELENMAIKMYCHQ